jgi:hypothetical protein
MSKARKLADLLDSAGDVAGGKIADDTINSEHFVDGGIDTAHIGASQVTAAKVAADVATQAELDTVSTVASAALPKAGGTMTGNISHASDFTLDIGGDILLDADGAEIRLLDAGSDFGKLFNDTAGGDGNFVIKSQNDDKDIIFHGKDGSSTIEAMRIDMSEGGNVLIGGTTNTYTAKSLVTASDIAFAVTDGTKTLASWAQHGGSSNNSSAIGTRSNHDFALITNDTKRIIINSSGNVGIGTTSPTEPLTIRSSGENVNTVLLAIGNDVHATNTKDAWIRYDASTGGSADQSFAIGASNNSFRFVHLGTRATAPHSGTELMRIDSSGKVGIGTSSPSNALHVHSGGTELNAWFQTTHSTNCKIQLSGAYTDTYSRITESAGQLSLEADIAGAAANSHVAFKVDSTERLRIASAGQIGLGGANYGTDGQVLTSTGASTAPAWEDAGGAEDPGADGWVLRADGTTENASAAVVDFGTEVHIGSNVSHSGGSITLGKSGWYFAIYKMTHYASDSDNSNLHLRVSTTKKTSKVYWESNDPYEGRTGFGLMYAASGTTINVYGTGKWYGHNSVDSSTYFMGWLISP